MIRQGTVQRLESDVAHVELDPLASCGRCSRSGSCGVQLLPAKQHAIHIECTLSKPHQLALGDRVTVNIDNPDSAWLSMVSLAYGLPVLGMLLGAAGGFVLHDMLSPTAAKLGFSLPSQDLFSAIGFVVGLAGGLFAWDWRKQSINPDSAKLGGKLL